jgi:uncharacterized protein
MSTTNTQLVQQAYAAFARQDVPGILELMSADVSSGIVGRAEDAPFLGMHSGKNGMADFLRQLGEAQDIHEFVPARFLAAEDKVFVWGHYRWTMRKSGVSKKSEWLHELTVRDGKITAWQGHNDTAMLSEAFHGRAAQR